MKHKPSCSRQHSKIDFIFQRKKDDISCELSAIHMKYQAYFLSEDGKVSSAAVAVSA